MKIRRTAGLVAGLLSLGLMASGPAVAAGPANVNVRVEGTSSTLVPGTALTTTTTPVGKPGGGTCSGTSALGALDRATAGDWAGTWDPDYNSWLVETIKGETHTAPFLANPAPYWSFWINYRAASAGLCDVELQAGDDVLLYADCYGTNCPSASPTPLRLTGVPTGAKPGDAANVKVDAMAWDGAATPAQNATVVAGGQTVTTGADGTARVVFAGQGPVTVQATKPDHVRSAAEQTCVTTGSDGACGTTVPAPPCSTSGTDGLCGTADKEAPVVRIADIRDGWYFSKRRAPRTLRGTVTADPSGIASVRIRFQRLQGRKCAAYDVKRERFRARSCKGTAPWFEITDRQDWSYLLPARLRPGLYTLAVRAVDRAGNASALVRGKSKVVFRVL
jgi:hypothetical protein